MEKLITIFSFTKIFYEAYHQNLPLHNYPASLQELLNFDVINLIKTNEADANKKVESWQQEAALNIERIGKIGTIQSDELNLNIEPSKLWGCSFMRAIRIFNERNFYITNCLTKKKSFEDDENLIKSQIKLEAFKNVSLVLYIEEPISETYVPTRKLDETIELKPPIINIQKEYLERFINSLDNFVLENSKDNLLKLFRGEKINEAIKFSCPANSVITFFKDRHTEQVIVSSCSLELQ
ncbi:hypothetical protein [Chryseobacterium gambrini]|uniref:hypothetical protein n=1 Tax=Chryseobacterium gambrini TaxID=373672 RepID=UPI0022F4062F|nr:hypothetical protein [Chryseobacterium gambrini]WBX96044.1 hypothetical protein PE065_14375 [Chryseobacterium gambrini]